MLRRVFAACWLLGALTLTGCAAPARHAEPPQVQLRRSLVTTLSAGDQRHMLNGLTFTVPSGWVGTATVYPPAASAESSASSPTEFVLLHKPEALYGPVTVMLYSAEDTPTLYTIMHWTDHSTVLSSAQVRIEMGGASTGSPVWRMYEAVTSVAGAQHGAVAYGGSPMNPRETSQGIWSLIDLRGAAVPKGLETP